MTWGSLRGVGVTEGVGGHRGWGGGGVTGGGGGGGYSCERNPSRLVFM